MTEVHCEQCDDATKKQIKSLDELSDAGGSAAMQDEAGADNTMSSIGGTEAKAAAGEVVILIRCAVFYTNTKLFTSIPVMDALKDRTHPFRNWILQVFQCIHRLYSSW